MNTAIPLIDEMQDNIASIREALQDFERECWRNEHSDEGNEDHIGQATAALDALEGHVGDLIP